MEEVTTSQPPIRDVANVVHAFSSRSQTSIPLGSLGSWVLVSRRSIAMDVVNGEIVPARTERSKSDIWRALQPSGAHVRPGVGPTSSLAMNPDPARWNRLPHDTHNILGAKPMKPLLQFSGSTSSKSRGDAMDDLGVQESCRAGWKRSFIEQDYHQPLVWSSASRSSDPESSHSTCEKKVHLQLETGDAPQTLQMRSSEDPEGSGAAVEVRERRGMELSTVDHDGVTWIAPLRSVLRKKLTASDVGALGRIVLPKKDAEGQFPLLETNAKYLEMDEYSFSRRWSFQYKCWINNKSRMYVLENTGEFVKYHGLKAHDNFIVYKDICGNFVVRGQKK